MPPRRFIVAILIAACTPPVASPRPRRLGDAMVEIAMRFERAGRAAEADRWELARYDLDEIDELLRDDLDGRPLAAAPRHLLDTFVAISLPELRAASTRRDGHAYELANARAARVCNGCHRASDKGFIEISENLGDVAPRVAQ